MKTIKTTIYLFALVFFCGIETHAQLYKAFDGLGKNGPSVNMSIDFAVMGYSQKAIDHGTQALKETQRLQESLSLCSSFSSKINRENFDPAMEELEKIHLNLVGTFGTLTTIPSACTPDGKKSVKSLVNISNQALREAEDIRDQLRKNDTKILWAVKTGWGKSKCKEQILDDDTSTVPGMHYRELLKNLDGLHVQLLSLRDSLKSHFNKGSISENCQPKNSAVKQNKVKNKPEPRGYFSLPTKEGQGAVESVE